MTHKEYCENLHVLDFIQWISNFLDKEGTFLHQYTVAKTKEKWICNSIYSAFENYKWKFSCINNSNQRITGSTFFESKEVLEECSINLKRALLNRDEVLCLQACSQILEWGGVTNKNNERIVNMTNRCVYFETVRDLFTKDMELEKYSNSGIIMNSGFTKIYSLLMDDFIIYDSRVGAALGLLVKHFCIDTKRDIIPQELMFAWGIKRQNFYTQVNINPRNPSNESYKFPLIGNSKIHIRSNIMANWLLKEILEKTDSRFNSMCNKIELRALESALFMIGYEVSNR